MKHWETFYMTVGAGCFVGAIISPASWFAVIIDCPSTWLGWKIPKIGVEK